MILLLVCLLFAAAQRAASEKIPLIDGEDMSDALLTGLPQFQRHLLHTQVVDTVSYAPNATSNRSAARAPARLTMCLKPEEDRRGRWVHSEYFRNTSAQVVQNLGCSEDNDMDDRDVSYCLEVYGGRFQFKDDGSYIQAHERADWGYAFQPYGADYAPEPSTSLFNELTYVSSTHGLMIERATCTYKKTERLTLLSFKIGSWAQIKKGFIIERHAMGRFTETENGQWYEATRYRTPHSYIDGVSAEVFDVFAKTNEQGVQTWTPTRGLRFETTGVSMKPVTKTHHSFFSPTSSGVLVATRAPSMTIEIDGSSQFVVHLSAHHYLVSFTHKKGHGSEAGGENAKNVTVAFVNEGHIARHSLTTGGEGAGVRLEELQLVNVGGQVSFRSREVKFGRSTRATVIEEQ